MASKTQKTKRGKSARKEPAKSSRGGQKPAGQKKKRAAGTGGTTATARTAGKRPRRSGGQVQSLGAVGVQTPVDAKLDPKKAAKLAETELSARAAIEAALDKKALLPVLIDVSSLASYTDFIGIVSGRSDRQVDAIADGITQAMKARGRSLLGQEGTGSGRWTLLDFGDVVIHVFYHPVREFYDLESLWVDAPRVAIRVPPEAIMAQPDALYGNL